MDYLGDAVKLVAIGGGVSGWSAWAWSKWHGRRARKRDEQEAIEHRNWHGYIEPGSINEWEVRLMEYPDRPTARVVLEVIDKEGAPDVNRAQNMRQQVEADGMVARPPSKEEWGFLIALRGERGYGKGGHIVR